ncbi:MAG: hypothetical protein MZV70_56615 [Desulfobacterales bacterium]|nr:hypothetical protein [Desulfobacterales bacterium]
MAPPGIGRLRPRPEETTARDPAAWGREIHTLLWRSRRLRTKCRAVSQGARPFGKRGIRPVCERSRKAAQRSDHGPRPVFGRLPQPPAIMGSRSI